MRSTKQPAQRSPEWFREMEFLACRAFLDFMKPKTIVFKISDYDDGDMTSKRRKKRKVSRKKRKVSP